MVLIKLQGHLKYKLVKEKRFELANPGVPIEEPTMLTLLQYTEKYTQPGDIQHTKMLGNMRQKKH